MKNFLLNKQRFTQLVKKISSLLMHPKNFKIVNEKKKKNSLNVSGTSKPCKI